MSNNYDRSPVQVTREEEGMYHLREQTDGSSRPKQYTSRSYEVVPVSCGGGGKSQQRLANNKPLVYTSDSDNDNFEEWTVSKKKINHKTRQVETRVSRQLLVEDGRVIADSGPQVTTRIKEDNKVEECEREKAPKNRAKFEALENAPEGAECSGRVLGEKKEIQRVSREVREENMQYHDERFKELTGQDVHRRAIHAPHELITITDKDHQSASKPRGKMVHYSNKGKKYKDTDEILEVAKLAIDGSITKEVKRTRHHEECSEDEKPDEKGEAEALREAPTVTRSSRRHVDYVNDFDDTSASSSDDEQQLASKHHSTNRKHESMSSAHSKSGARKSEQAFPRYEIDPLLNSLNEDDFRPSSGRRMREHKLEVREKAKTSSSSSSSSHSDSDSAANNRKTQQQQQQHLHRSHTLTTPASAVEIPEEYRINRHHHKKSSSHVGGGARHPAEKSHLSHRSSKSHRSQWEDASVQAHLSEEEEERKSTGASSAGMHSHERNTRKLERQSQATRGSRRNYYYGQPGSRRAASVLSSSSASSSDEDEADKLRKEGARSRDSGFKSPHSVRTGTPYSGSSQPIYAVSSKSKKYQPTPRAEAVSPTPSNVSQRSVKTTTRTFATGLEEKPERKIKHYAPVMSHSLHQAEPPSRKSSMRSPTRSGNNRRTTTGGEESNGGTAKPQVSQRKSQQRQMLDAGPKQSDARSRVMPRELVADRNSLEDSISLSSSSLGPLATTIKVPYMKEAVADVTRTRETPTAGHNREPTQEGQATARQNHFNYRTIITNIHPPAAQPATLLGPKQQIVDTYNVRVVEHDSPFRNKLAPVNSVSELSNSIARLEQLSSELDSFTLISPPEKEKENVNEKQKDKDITTMNPTATTTTTDNNNSTAFNLNDFIKQHHHKASTVVVPKPASSDSLLADPDSVSLQSCDSLRSSHTYHVRSASNTNQQVEEFIRGQQIDNDTQNAHVDKQHDDDDDDDEKFNDEKYFPVERVEPLPVEDEKKPKAWIFNPNDGSTTNIVAPPKPEEPKPAKVDSREMSESRGGRAYYLQLLESAPTPLEQVHKVGGPHSSSQGNLYTLMGPPSLIDRQSRSGLQLNTSINKSVNRTPTNQHRALSSQTKLLSATKSNIPMAADSSSASFPAALNRSKSSSCLTVSSTRPSKYSIYGGLRHSSESKPVPRLSYSKAIGPKSQRQLGAQQAPKTPSRYLKMR